MNCEKCNSELKVKGFRLSYNLKCHCCGAVYQPKHELSNAKQANIWYIGLFVFIFSNQYLIRHFSVDYSTLSVTAVSLLYGAIFFMGLYRFRPQYSDTQYIYMPDYEYPLAKNDMLAIGGIVLFVSIVLALFLFI